MKVLILGITSWIGLRLSKELKKNLFVVSGTSRNIAEIKYFQDIKLIECSSCSDYISVIRSNDFDFVINLLRGEEGQDLLLHKKIVEICSLKEVFYCYASSALALDGYNFNENLTEKLLAKSKSKYGIFKGLCEDEILKKTELRSLIIRFSSIQGWPEHKPSRNELFFRKLLSKEKILVDRGIVQNRLYDKDLATMIVRLLLDKKHGIYHLGTLDSSEEFSFLKNLCSRFNFNDSLILSGEKKDTNINVISRKFFNEYPLYSYKERDTIDKLYSEAPPWLK